MVPTMAPNDGITSPKDESKLLMHSCVDDKSVTTTTIPIMEDHHHSTRRHYWVVASVVLMYWSISISMVFLNKFILSGSFGEEDLTIFAAWFQSIAAVGFIWGVSLGGRKCKIKIPKIEPNQLYSQTMIMLSMASVCCLTFNNLMLKHIGVAFYQVARSFTIIFTIIFSAVFLKKGLTTRAVCSCLLVVAGFFIGIDQEDVSGTLSVKGVIYGLMSSLSAAVSGILFKKAESLLERDSLKLAYYNNMNCVLLFLPLVLGSGQFVSVFRSEFIYQINFWLILCFTGVLSLCIGWVSALQIKHTSPIAHHLSINAKSVCQTVLAVLFYQETKTMYWWLGNFLVVAGVLFYTLSRILEDSKRSKDVTINGQLPITNSKPHANGHTKD
ncbi:GDP-fucose transporter 1-like isoform X1 [Mya arenaria]|uniref:GDP-fucose transporter 1-like isoform X1 n=1 Tax=Mya arenaria TaxID=6604 RepID=UPI0022E26401|nr:GDP-fucose transporter 1-like isoform X1 [Mya arenaria]